MADHLPPLLLEACVVVGASSVKLQEFSQSVNGGSPVCSLLRPEALHVITPSLVRCDAVKLEKRERWALVRKKKEQLSLAEAEPGMSVGAQVGHEGVNVIKDIDLMALPHLCFPGGLQVAKEGREEQFHFLVFTDVCGNKTHGVVMQCYRPILDVPPVHQNGTGTSVVSQLFSAYAFCVISKHPYYTALKDCLSGVLTQFRTCCLTDLEEKVREFANKLALVPVPPPGQLHLMFTFNPLTIVLPSREDPDHPAVDIDLHLPFLCFRPQKLLQVISCLLQEQRIVLFSNDWARLTLVAESLLLFLQPLSWQQPYVPVLAKDMLDFLMAPTAFLMGCHLSHFEEVAAETDDLILINIDDGSVSSSCSENADVPEIPLAAAGCFARRCLTLPIHFDLQQCQQAACTDITQQRRLRREWQQNLNHSIQKISLELIVNIFRDVCSHLNYEHRVFDSEEFLKSREPSEQLFFKRVLETHSFHVFLKDRLNRKMDNFTRMELSTRSEMQKMKTTVENLRRPTMQEIQARRKSSETESRLSKRLGMSLPNLGGDQPLRHSLLPSIIMANPALRSPPKPVKVFKLPELPVSLSARSVLNYYSEVILQLGKAISSAQHENSALLARFYYMRGIANTFCSRRLEALSDFQNLNKTDTAIFPSQLVTWLAASLDAAERQQAERRPELKRLFLKTENEKPQVQPDNKVKKFKLPRTHLLREEFVRCIQESAIVKDVATIHRLFEALSVESHGDSSNGAGRKHSSAPLSPGRPKQVDPELFRVFYTFWKQTEAEAQDVNLPTEVIDHLDNSECVYKLSSCVKTSQGCGKIAMTQRRLFLLMERQPGFQEITKFRDIKEVRVSTAPLQLVPFLRIENAKHPGVFKAYLKTETDLWNLMVKEMWAGRKMADQHKDPQYMAQALTNVLLMDSVVGCVQNQKSIYAASKLALFDKVKHEVPKMMPKITLETLKHKVNPSQDLAEPQSVHVLLYMPGQLTCDDAQDEMNPKLWVALSGGRVVVFDAASWSVLQACIQVGASQLNCMLALVQEQVWVGSQDSIIYVIDTSSMSCNKQLTEHRHEVTGLTVDASDTDSSKETYSCSLDGTILQWDTSSLKVKRQFHTRCEGLSSILVHNGALWCCCTNTILELKKSGTPQRKMAHAVEQRSIQGSFSSFILIQERGEVWTGCADSGDLCLWHLGNQKHPFERISLQGSSGVTCMIRVKNQIWVGCHNNGMAGQHEGQVLVVDLDSHIIAKVLQAHSDTIQTLCSAEDRYVLSGSARGDGKIAIWKVD